MENKMTQKEIDQMVKTCSNLVKTNHNLNRRIDHQRDMLIESRRILKVIRTEAINYESANNTLGFWFGAIRRIDKFLNILK